MNLFAAKLNQKCQYINKRETDPAVHAYVTIWLVNLSNNIVVFKREIDPTVHACIHIRPEVPVFITFVHQEWYQSSRSSRVVRTSFN